MMFHDTLVFRHDILHTEGNGFRFARFSFRCGNGNNNGINEETVHKGHIGRIQCFPLHKKDFPAAPVHDIFFKNGTVQFSAVDIVTAADSRLGSQFIPFTVEIECLHIAVFFPDDDILGDINKTACKVTGVCCTESRIGKTLAGAVGRRKVVKDGQPFTEVCLNRQFYRFTGCIGNQAAHPRQLADLVIVAAGAGLGHHGERIHFRHGRFHRFTDIIGRFFPNFNDFPVSFVIRHQAAAEIFLNFFNLRFTCGQDIIFGFRYGHVINADRNAGNKGIMESEGFNGVQEISRFFEAQLLKAVIDKFAHLLLADGDAETFFSVRAFIEEAERFRNGIVENQAPRGRDDKTVSRYVHFNEIMDLYLVQCIGQHDFIVIGVRMEFRGIKRVFLFLAFFYNGQIV